MQTSGSHSSTDHPVTVPELGTGDEPIVVGPWLVDPGDPVLAGDRVVEVLVRGISVSLTSDTNGELERVELSTGNRAAVGQILGWVRDTGPSDSAESTEAGT